MKPTPERVRSMLAALDIPEDLIRARSLPLCPEAERLVIAGVGEGGREHRLTPGAAAAWRRMTAAALADGVVIRIASAFRSIDRQDQIVREKLAQGVPLTDILSASAPPGYSEHHTGRAIDITTHGVTPFELEFANTPAFRWLSANAARFGFALSFPEGNPYGYQHEPWHWYYQAAEGGIAMRSYLWVSGLLFGAVSLLHLLRLAYGWPAQIGGWTVPLELSWIGMIVAAALCAWAFALARRATP
jgi:D-alanyl-D-alanine carboxypeptidase